MTEWPDACAKFCLPNPVCCSPTLRVVCQRPHMPRRELDLRHELGDEVLSGDLTHVHRLSVAACDYGNVLDPDDLQDHPQISGRDVAVPDRRAFSVNGAVNLMRTGLHTM